jgi:hypothetical protein
MGTTSIEIEIILKKFNEIEQSICLAIPLVLHGTLHHEKLRGWAIL